MLVTLMGLISARFGVSFEIWDGRDQINTLCCKLSTNPICRKSKNAVLCSQKIHWTASVHNVGTPGALLLCVFYAEVDSFHYSRCGVF